MQELPKMNPEWWEDKKYHDPDMETADIKAIVAESEKRGRQAGLEEAQNKVEALIDECDQRKDRSHEFYQKRIGRIQALQAIQSLRNAEQEK